LIHQPIVGIDARCRWFLDCFLVVLIFFSRRSDEEVKVLVEFENLPPVSIAAFVVCHPSDGHREFR